MAKGLQLAAAGVCVFVVVAMILWKVMPGPLKESDYLVIGSVATLIALLLLFLVWASTSMKASDVFFKRRRK